MTKLRYWLSTIKKKILMRYWLIRYFRCNSLYRAVGTNLKYFDSMQKTKELKQKYGDDIPSMIRRKLYYD